MRYTVVCNVQASAIEWFVAVAIDALLHHPTKNKGHTLPIVHRRRVSIRKRATLNTRRLEWLCNSRRMALHLT